jgi:pyruvate/2-oxoglutarate dehydrogenase complex dihydrolipoamide acyltransferase (E2) component
MRPDGVRVKNLSYLQRIVPYLMKTKHESLIYFNQTVGVDTAFELVNRLNESAGKKEYTLFTVFLAALARVGKEFPELGRFFVGKRLYERKDIVFSFTAKNTKNKDASSVVIKMRFKGTETIREVAALLNREKENIRNTEQDSAGDSDSILRVFFLLPPGIRSLFLGLLKLLNLWNCLPKSVIEADPFFTACYITNVGSLGIDAPFHHLYEWGTASLFMAIGKAHLVTVPDTPSQFKTVKVVDLRFTLDDRITDGFYCARALERLREYIEKPESLL